MPTSNRRRFLTLAGGTGIATALGRSAFAAPASQDFDFIFLTDTHIQPELDAAKGCAMAFRKMRGIKSDFAIQGGDHVSDALMVPKARSISLFDLYDQTQQELSLKVYHTLGNHDVLGLSPSSGVDPADPQYGKKYYEDHVSKLYYSFDHKGVHFIVLDSIGITPDRAYEGRMDAAQVQWLAGDLRAKPAGTPIVVVTHIPLVSAVACYNPPPATPPAHNGSTVVNSIEVVKLFEGHNILAVLQGHWHLNARGLARRSVYHQWRRMRQLVARHAPWCAGGVHGGIYARGQAEHEV